jgi:hypothetical protein
MKQPQDLPLKEPKAFHVSTQTYHHHFHLYQIRDLHLRHHHVSIWYFLKLSSIYLFHYSSTITYHYLDYYQNILVLLYKRGHQIPIQSHLYHFFLGPVHHRHLFMFAQNLALALLFHFGRLHHFHCLHLFHHSLKFHSLFS